MYVPLNIHSYYSLGCGTSSPEDIFKAAKAYGLEILAITDTNNLYGLIFSVEFARTFGVRPIVGAEISSPGRRATLLVRNRVGYANLCHIITERHTRQGFSLDEALLRRHDGLVILTDNLTLIDRLDGVVQHLYAEITRGSPVIELLRKSRARGIKPVATARTFWIDNKDYHLHRLLRAISLNTTLHSLPKNDCAPPNAQLLKEDEFRVVFDFCPEAVDNTNEVADLCRWTPDFGIVYPESEPGMNGQAIKTLRQKAYDGGVRRYGSINPEIRDRLEHELRMIEDKDFAPVFLVVEDIVNRFPRTCGRGSAAASIVSYCLGITHVEPLRHNLFFERFINHARIDPPDIDVDFAWDERDEVLEYVFNKYGFDQAAMVSNHVTFQKRAAIRETAKVYGLPDAEINAVTKRISYGYSFTGESIKEHPALREHDFAPPWDDILAWANRLEDIPRHLSVHCGGVVITPGPTADWVPTEVAAKGVKVIHWEKDQTEDAGLVKIDLLGNRSLAVIRDTLEAIREHHDVNIDYASWNPVDDPETQALIARGDTMGVFYVESPATRLLQKKAGIGDYDHLVLHSSIIRPAANKYINQYLRRLKGESYEPMHPLIGDLLDDNYGIMVYQEDVTRVAMRLAGFKLAEADELRKIISKKHKHRRLLDLMRKFYTGAKERGVGEEAVDKVWDMIMSFAGYSFCKPHSASYALVSFKSAYLRAHYPAEFIAGVISNQGGFYSTFAYVSEARRMGLRVLPPDINESEIKYTGMGDWIRVGLMQIKGLSKEAMERLVQRRHRDPYLSFEDCMKRAKLSPSEVKLLVKTGCFDRLEPERSRPELLWQITLSGDNKRNGSQQELFEAPTRRAPRPPQYDERTLLAQEVETLGFLISRHPLDLYREQLKHRSVTNACDLGKHVGRKVEVVGWLVTGKVVTTRDRDPMEFVTFEDTTALIETVFFPEAFRRFSHILSYSRPYRLYGKVEEDFGAITMTIERVVFL